MEDLPFPDEIVLKILGYLNIFDLAKCAQVSKQLMNICEDKEFQYCELKKIFKNSNLKLASNDFIMVGVSHQDAVKAIKEALKRNGRKLELIMERKGQFDNGSCVFSVELYGVNSFVAFCSFFPCSLTVFHMGRPQKSGGRQQKSSRADKQLCFP
jgi:hypothetical protein